MVVDAKTITYILKSSSGIGCLEGEMAFGSNFYLASSWKGFRKLFPAAVAS